MENDGPVQGVRVRRFETLETQRMSVMSVVVIESSIDAQGRAERAIHIRKVLRYAVIRRAFGAPAVCHVIGINLLLDSVKNVKPLAGRSLAEINNGQVTRLARRVDFPLIVDQSLSSPSLPNSFCELKKYGIAGDWCGLHRGSHYTLFGLRRKLRLRLRKAGQNDQKDREG